MKLGVDKDTVWITAYTGSRIAYMCQRRVMNFAINKEGAVGKQIAPNQGGYDSQRVIPSLILSEKRKKDG